MMIIETEIHKLTIKIHTHEHAMSVQLYFEIKCDKSWFEKDIYEKTEFF